MSLQIGYPFYVKKSRLEYQFESIGTKGRIVKVVRFVKIDENFYNLGFGDLNEKTHVISDTVITNNGDVHIILRTVGSIIIHFTSERKDTSIFFQGITKSRNRLYQMQINRFFDEIREVFIVLGYYEGEWILFKSDQNYDAFIGKRIQ
jgi:hypothetical protein